MSDLIDRQEAIEAIMSEPPDAHYPSWYADILWKLPTACNETKRQATVSSDCINRQDAIDAINAYLGLSAVSRTIQNMTSIQEILENLPSAEPQKKGKWIYGEKSGQDGWYCSECGGFIPWYYDFYGLDNIDFIEDFKTCPFCDSKMVSYTGADTKEGEEE